MYKSRLVAAILVLAAAGWAQPVSPQLASLASSGDRQALHQFAVARAAANPNDAEGALAYFVLGYSEWQDHQFGEAASYFRLARAVATPLSDYTDYYLASSLQASGDAAGAIPFLDGFDARFRGSLLIGRARNSLAVSLVATGDAANAAKAAAILETHLDSSSSALLLARAYEAAGQKAKAEKAYRDVYYRYPASPEAVEAAKHKAQFPAPGTDLLRQRADMLMAAKKYPDAQTAYRALSAADHEHAQIELAALLYKLKRDTAARTALLAVKPATPEGAAERLYWLAECNRRLKREDDMLADVRELEEKHPKSPWFEESLFSAASFELLHNGMGDSSVYYDKLAKFFPKGKYAAQSHWKVAWTRYRAGDFDAARDLMDEQTKRFPDSVYSPAAFYWQGRIAESNQDPDNQKAAQGYFRKAVEGYPSNFYGVLAREHLAVPPNHAGTSYLPPFPPPDSLLRHRMIECLRSLGLLDLAAGELRQLTQVEPKNKPYWLLELASVERDRGRLFVALDTARRAVPNYTQLDPDSVPRSVWELLYPNPWWTELREQAEREGIDPYLALALMRQESAFNERAISPAKAYGLMQILPSTGRRLARQLGVTGFSTQSLLNPRINIRMGVHYLKEMIDECGGRVDDALAAYNAGTNRVVAWRAIGYRDDDEFVESIPFTETREYVQIVLRNAALYKRLYGKPL